ncbi:hypothetical protein D347_00017 [Enterococcus faecalis LA3B-2]|nr:hypothetical protein D347_00017 [Enterococcus faecalis LA3B-2]
MVCLTLEDGHRITQNLQVLAVPQSTYYAYLKWKPSKSAQKRQQMDGYLEI